MIIDRQCNIPLTLVKKMAINLNYVHPSTITQEELMLLLNAPIRFNEYTIECITNYDFPLVFHIKIDNINDYKVRFVEYYKNVLYDKLKNSSSMVYNDDDDISASVISMKYGLQGYEKLLINKFISKISNSNFKLLYEEYIHQAYVQHIPTRRHMYSMEPIVKKSGITSYMFYQHEETKFELFLFTKTLKIGSDHFNIINM